MFVRLYVWHCGTIWMGIFINEGASKPFKVSLPSLRMPVSPVMNIPTCSCVSFCVLLQPASVCCSQNVRKNQKQRQTGNIWDKRQDAHRWQWTWQLTQMHSWNRTHNRPIYGSDILHVIPLPQLCFSKFVGDLTSATSNDMGSLQSSPGKEAPVRNAGNLRARVWTAGCCFWIVKNGQWIYNDEWLIMVSTSWNGSFSWQAALWSVGEKMWKVEWVANPICWPQLISLRS